MGVRNATLGGTDWTEEKLTPTDLNNTVEELINVGTNTHPTLPPIGSIIGWLKTFSSADSGTTTSTTANKLIESGQNFTSTVSVGMIVKNTTDTTWSYVTAVDSDTQLSLNDDIMVSGESYTIYTTPNLPAGWLECDGSSISDASSPYNGGTLPDMNSTQRFLRGNTTSGTTGGSDTNSHTHTTTVSAMGNVYNLGSTYNPAAPGNYVSGAPSDTNNMPAYYEVVWIMRIK